MTRFLEYFIMTTLTATALCILYALAVPQQAIEALQAAFLTFILFGLSFILRLAAWLAKP